MSFFGCGRHGYYAPDGHTEADCPWCRDEQRAMNRACDMSAPQLSPAHARIIKAAEAWAAARDGHPHTEYVLRSALYEEVRALHPAPRPLRPEEGWYWVLMQSHGAVWQVGQVILIEGGFEVALCGYPGTYEGELFEIGPLIPEPRD